MRIAALLVWLVAAAWTPAFAQSDEESARIAWTLERGRLLFEIDRAAWVTTDDLTARVGDLNRAGVRGWTVEREDDGYRVIYYIGEGEARVALYHGRVENRRVVSAEVFPAGARPPLTVIQHRLADARGAVGRMELRACASSGLNLAIIPPDVSDDPLDIYVLTPQAQSGVYPFGGHSRATVSANGEIVSQRAFTNSCINVSDGTDGEGGRPVALLITHLLDPVPTEIHVFLSIWIGLPIYVSTAEPQRVWEVTAEHIRLVDQPR
ncbi:MAG: hypothetical protein KF780_04415 [Sphingomonas sp.]|nr:hypothetical protein [Sphingomonas sp.]